MNNTERQTWIAAPAVTATVIGTVIGTYIVNHLDGHAPDPD